MTEQPVPGIQQSFTSKILDKGTGLFQSKAPLNSVHLHLCSLGFPNGNLDRQMILHKYGTHLNEDFSQFLIYDLDDSKGRLIGVEYVVTERLFKTFSQDEKKLWHSLYYEVKSGILLSPRNANENACMNKLLDCYAKTLIFWEPYKESLPLGGPHLWMSFTSDSQVNLDLLHERDRMLQINSEEKRKERMHLPVPILDPKCDTWFKEGEVIQFEIKSNKSDPK